MVDKKTDDLEEMIEETGEDNISEENLEDIEAIEDNKIKSLQAKLKACQTEKATHLEDLQRAKAEFLNVRKRLEEEKVHVKTRTENDCVLRLLPLCDSFTMAMSNTEAWEATDENWRKGVESIHSQLTDLLKSYQVTTYGAVGDEFDPERHDAIGNEPVENESAIDTIINVVQQGYERTIGNETVTIRPARVIVGVAA